MQAMDQSSASLRVQPSLKGKAIHSNPILFALHTVQSNNRGAGAWQNLSNDPFYLGLLMQERVKYLANSKYCRNQNVHRSLSHASDSPTLYGTLYH